jgi:hypothetical protein
MAGPNKRSARANSPRRRFERSYRDALEKHFRDPSDAGLAAARVLGEQAIAEGVSIVDMASIHMQARRGYFPDLAPRLADIDAFLRESLTAFEHQQAELRRQSERRHVAERASRHFRTMRDVASDLAQATTRRAVASIVLKATLDLSGGRIGAVALFGGASHHRSQRPEVLATVPARDARRVRALTAAAGAVEGLLEAHSSLELSSRDEIRHAIGEAPEATLELAALAALPIVWGGRVHGAVIVGWTDGSAYDGVDRGLIVGPVLLGAAALERAGRCDTDHEIALTLQRGMLAMPTFELPEVLWSAHYSSAARGLVGGDWYDVMDLNDRVGLAVGDIVGRGLDAAVAMGQVRSASRALASCFDRPDQLIVGLDRFASATGCGDDSSMVYVTVDRRSGEVTYSLAGHPPPLLMAPDGTTMWLDKESSGLLGRGGVRRSSSLVVEPGTTIVLYTDGLVERRGETLDQGLARLAEAARTVLSEDRSSPARRLAAMVTSPETINDDVAVVVATYLGPKGR